MELEVEEQPALWILPYYLFAWSILTQWQTSRITDINTQVSLHGRCAKLVVTRLRRFRLIKNNELCWSSLYQHVSYRYHKPHQSSIDHFTTDPQPPDKQILIYTFTEIWHFAIILKYKEMCLQCHPIFSFSSGFIINSNSVCKKLK